MELQGDRQDGQLPFVLPDSTRWKLTERERELFARAAEATNWQLADEARRLLIDMTHFFSEIVYQHHAGTEPEALPPGPAQRVAAVSLGELAVRSAGSAIALISTGHVPESGASVRRLIEANLRYQAVLDDASGQQARRWLEGRPIGTVGRLAQRYGKTEDLKLLSVFAHSDVRGLMPLLTGPPGAKRGIDLRPNRGDGEAAPLLHAVAHQAIFMCSYVATAFHANLKLPDWVQSELERLKDVTTELNERRRAEGGSAK